MQCICSINIIAWYCAWWTCLANWIGRLLKGSRSTLVWVTGSPRLVCLDIFLTQWSWAHNKGHFCDDTDLHFSFVILFITTPSPMHHHEKHCHKPSVVFTSLRLIHNFIATQSQFGRADLANPLSLSGEVICNPNLGYHTHGRVDTDELPRSILKA